MKISSKKMIKSPYGYDQKADGLLGKILFSTKMILSFGLLTRTFYVLRLLQLLGRGFFSIISIECKYTGFFIDIDDFIETIIFFNCRIKSLLLSYKKICIFWHFFEKATELFFALHDIGKRSSIIFGISSYIRGKDFNTAVSLQPRHIYSIQGKYF